MPRTKNAPLRLPVALRKNRGTAAQRRRVTSMMRAGGLHTVCEEARCPNIGECFSSGTATFMILGDTCTRSCTFCSVATGRPLAVDPAEPETLAQAAAELNLRHVVITSVDRDDLPDLGARHFARCISAVQKALPGAAIEVLTPDFKGRPELIDTVLDAGPNVFNHNIETVERLYRTIRPQSHWDVTSKVLAHVVKSGHPAVKSGLMVGLGESDAEVLATLEHLADLGVHIATAGQYLRPTRAHREVHRYVEDSSYRAFEAHGLQAGLSHVFAGPFVRSSYHAAEAAQAHAVQAHAVQAHAVQAQAAQTKRQSALPVL